MTPWNAINTGTMEIDAKGRAAFGATLATAHDNGEDVMAVRFRDDTVQ